MKTKDFVRLSDEEYKEQTRVHWGNVPCGSNYSDEMFMTKDFFEEIESHRYKSHPWILEAIRGFDIRGKKVLEIGYGMGTDHLQMARRGGSMYGLDLTPMSYEVTKKRFEIYGFHSELTVGDAENLPYPDDYFDFVYSFGVIHHTPNTQKVIDEIHRVLKPEGKVWIAVYHRNSIFFWWTVYLYGWVLKGGYTKETLEARISRIEYPNDNPNLVIKLYKKKEFEGMFPFFKVIKSDIDHLLKEDIALFGKYIPKILLNILRKTFGWYIIVEGFK